MADDLTTSPITTDPSLTSTLTSSLTLSTDQSDYAPGSTATFTVDGVTAGDKYEFVVTDIYGNPVSGTNLPWDVVANADGTITTTWAVGMDALGEAFQVMVTDETTGQVATASFTDGPGPVYDFSALSGDITSGNGAGAKFINTTANPTGTGNFSFLGIQNNGTEQGYNTAATPTPLDTDDKSTASVHTGAIVLGSVPLVNADGTAWDGHSTAYRQFLLDIDQSGNNGAPSTEIILDALQIYLANNSEGGSLTSPIGDFATASAFAGHASLVYNLDQTVLLTDHSNGNGALDYQILIPDSFFAAVGGTDNSSDNHFVYFYAKFSGANAGFEEFGVAKTTSGGDGGGGGTTPDINVEKLVSVDGGTNWYFTADDGDDTAASISLLSGIPVANLHSGTPTLLPGFHTPEYKFVVTNLGTANLVNVTISDDAYHLGTLGTIDTLAVGATKVVTFGDGTTSPPGWVDGTKTDTVTASGQSADDGSTVTDKDSVTFKGIQPSINIEKLVSVDGTNWWLLPDDNGLESASDIANITQATGLTLFDGTTGHLFLGTPIAVAGSNLQYEFVITNTGDVTLTNIDLSDFNNVTNTSVDLNGASLGTDVNITSLDPNGFAVVSFTSTAVVGTSNSDTAMVTADKVFDSTATDSVTPTDTDTAAYTGIHLTLPGLTKGFWAQHTSIWDVSTSDDSTWAGKLSGIIAQNSDINPQPTQNWNHDGITPGNPTGTIDSKDYGLLLGDLNHNGTPDDGTGLDLFFDLASAQALINSGSSTTDARQILASQALAAQLNEYNDYIYDKAQHGNPPAAGFDASPTGLIEDAVQWLLGTGPFSPNGHSNVDVNHANDFGTPTVISSFGGDYTISNKGVITLGTGNGGVVLSNSNDASWHTFATILDNSTTPATPIKYTDLLIGDSHYGHTFNVQADGEGLKNALQAYNQGQLVVSDDGSLIGWSSDGGHTVNDVHSNTAEAFWGILEDQNLAHGASTIVGVQATNYT